MTTLQLAYGMQGGKSVEPALASTLLTPTAPIPHMREQPPTCSTSLGIRLNGEMTSLHTSSDSRAVICPCPAGAPGLSSRSEPLLLALLTAAEAEGEGARGGE